MLEFFVFNIHNKYTPSNHDMAIYTDDDGFCFGNCVLGVKSSIQILNENNGGNCYSGKLCWYDIEGEVSPLTNQKKEFTIE